MFEVRIRMDHKSALITVSMLSTLLTKKIDYLDLLKPFILHSLPKQKEQVIDVNLISQRLKDDFGFEDFPINVIYKILNRLTIDENCYLRKSRSKYLVNNIYDSTEFDDKKVRIKEIIDQVVSELRDFIIKHSIELRRISLEEAKNALIKFMDYSGFTSYKDIEKLRTYTKKIHNLNYTIARFIIEEYEKKSTTFDKIQEIVRGFLIYKAIYFYGNDDQVDFEVNLENTVFYFDTRLLIYALGYHHDEDKKSTLELIKLIMEKNGKVKSFSIYRDEIINILTAYSKNIGNRDSFSLANLSKNQYSESDIILKRKYMESDLNEMGITFEDVYAYGKLSESGKNSEDGQYSGYIDLIELKKMIIEKYERQKSNGNSGISNLDAIDHDVEVISSISRIRGDKSVYDIEKCKAILVTTNRTLVNAIKEHSPGKFKNGEINFAITDIDLTALLWLGSFDKKSSLPTILLLESAYAAKHASNEIIDIFNAKLNLYEAEGKITPDKAFVLRSQYTVREDVAEFTENDPDRMTFEMIFEIEKKLSDRLTDGATSKVRELETKLSELEQVNIEIKREKSKLSSDKEKLYKNIEEKWVVLSNRICLVCKILSYIIVSFFIILLGYIQFVELSNPNLRLIYSIVLIFSSITSYIAFIRKSINNINVGLDKILSYLKCEYISRENEKLNKVFEENVN